MNTATNNVGNANSGMATGTQTAREPQGVKDPSFFAKMFDEQPSEDNFDFGFSDSGEIQIGKKLPQETQTQDQEDSDVGVAADEVSTPSSSESSNTENKALAERVQGLESALEKLVPLLAQVIQGKAPQQEQAQEQDDEEFDYTDRSSIERIVERTIEKSLSKVLAPLQQTQQKTELYMQYSEAANKHGQEFVTMLPVIKELMVGDTSLNFDSAFAKAKSLQTLFGVSAKKDDTNQQTTQPVKKSATALVEKAKQLQTVSGVSATGETKPKQHNSVRASAEAAWEELFGQN
jgi:hypothetical protein